MRRPSPESVQEVIAYLEHADPDTGLTTEEMIGITGMSLSTIRRVVEHLRDAGRLGILNPNRGGGIRHRYVLKRPRIPIPHNNRSDYEVTNPR